MMMMTERDMNRVRNKWYIILILKINAWCLLATRYLPEKLDRDIFNNCMRDVKIVKRKRTLERSGRMHVHGWCREKSSGNADLQWIIEIIGTNERVRWRSIWWEEDTKNKTFLLQKLGPSCFLYITFYNQSMLHINFSLSVAELLHKYSVLGHFLLWVTIVLCFSVFKNRKFRMKAHLHGACQHILYRYII